MNVNFDFILKHVDRAALHVPDLGEIVLYFFNELPPGQQLCAELSETEHEWGRAMDRVQDSLGDGGAELWDDLERTVLAQMSGERNLYAAIGFIGGLKYAGLPQDQIKRIAKMIQLDERWHSKEETAPALKLIQGGRQDAKPDTLSERAESGDYQGKSDS